MHKNTHFQSYGQRLEKYSGTVQQLAYSDWHQQARREEVGDGGPDKSRLQSHPTLMQMECTFPSLKVHMEGYFLLTKEVLTGFPSYIRGKERKTGTQARHV